MASIFKITAGAAVVATALYAAAGYLAVPTLVKSTLADTLGKQLGRSVTVTNVAFNPWTWEFTLEGLTVAGKNNNPPLLSLDRFYVNASAQTLVELAPVIDEVTVDGLNAVVALDDEDMRRLMNGHGSAEGGSSEKASSESSSLPSFAVYNISVKNSSLQVLDRARAIDQSVTDFNLELPFVSTLANSKSSLVTPKLSMKLNGTPIFATGSTQPFGTTLSARLNMKISNLDLAPVFKLVPALNTPSLMLENGRLSTEVNVVFRNATSGKPGKMLVSGTVNVNDLTAVQQVSNRVQPLASFKKASLQLTELDLLEHQASVGSIVIQDPKVHFVNTPSGLNVSQTAQGFSSGAAADSGKDSGSNSGWHWRVDSVQIRNGNATWNDSTVRPAAKINVTALNATVTGLTNAANAKPAKAEAGAKVFGGMLSLAADVTPAPLVVNATLKASGLQAAQLASYIRNATGFDASGAVSLNVKAAVKGSAVTGSGTASLTNLQVKQGKSTLVSARTASVKLGSLDTAKQSVNVDSILLDTAVVNAVMTSEGLNLMPSKAGAAKKAAQKDADAKTTEKAGKPWQWKVASADVKNSRFNFRDTSVKPNAAITVSDINASVKNLSSAEGAAATVKMSAGTAGGTLAADGTVTLSPMTADVSTTLSGINMKSLSSVMTAYAGIGAQSGTLESKGRFGLASEKDKQVASWAGDISMAKFNMLNAKGRSLMTWNNAALTGLAVKTTDPVTLCVKKAEIDQPGTRETKAIRELSGLASLLTGKDKYAKKTEKYLGGSIVLNGVRYENGRFSAEGIDGNAVATALLTKLSGAMSTKLQ